MQGGALTVFSGVPGFMIIHLVDKGFKRYLIRRGLSFEDHIAQLTQQSNGLVLLRRPIDSTDDYYDSNGVLCPPPAGHPLAPQNTNTLLLAKQANSCRQTSIERHK